MNHLPKTLLCAAMGLVMVSACAPTVVDGNGAGGVVKSPSRLNVGFVGFEFTSAANRARELSLKKADRHCAQFDKRARIIAKGNNAFQFECFGPETKSTPKS